MSDSREYVGPVRPTGGDWSGICGVGVFEGRSEEWVAGLNHALRVMALWLEFQQSLPSDGSCSPPGLSGIGMRKSNLLGRLMRGEEIRRRPCPEHKGRLVSAPWEREGLACGCEGTGWLPNDPDEGRRAPRPAVMAGGRRG